MKWYEIKAKSEEDGEIWLYDEIGLWGIGAKEFIVELNALKSKRIDMHINSPGGDVFDGAAIFNSIKRHPASVTSYIDGLAASIASVIALAGEKVIMAKNALYVMHNPSGFTMGTAEDMRKTAEILDKVRGTMIGAYMEKSGKSEEEISALLNAETWLDADEAKELKFADAIGEEMDLAACARFIPYMAKKGYKHIPVGKFGDAKRDGPTERDLERVLRDAGCSAKQAKRILAQGFSSDHRDDDSVGPAVPVGTQRDVAVQPVAKKDKYHQLVIRADIMASTPK